MTKEIKPLAKMKLEIAKIRLEIKAGKEKNTNAHKKLKKTIAQMLTKGETK